MLNVSNLSASYGAIQAVRSVGISVKAGSFAVLLGTNGAGKSTTLRSIAGLHRPVQGSIQLDGQEISKLALHKVVRAGLAFVPEGRMVVAPLTVQENLTLSSYSGRNQDAGLADRVYDLFPRLKERRKQPAGLLSGGEQQMLAIGRAMMTAPKMLVLDEPSMGLAPSIIDLVFQAIVALHKQGQSILLVEQNATIALSVCDYGYVMRRGEITIEGTPEELKKNPDVLNAYLT
ncbi:MAG: ABC transporter ATP-binding protein [Betaproteobacteria bacterium]|nr:ABC transporter ATP-binding protein [Betaproteobacteria bacterium]